MMRVEVVRAWPRRHESQWLDLSAGARVADALALVGHEDAVAIFGERVGGDHRLAEGDRLELLRPLVADPKDARRRRASRGAS